VISIDADRAGLQEALNKLMEWASLWGMKFNVAKCKVSICTTVQAVRKATPGLCNPGVVTMAARRHRGPGKRTAEGGEYGVRSEEP
jgi:hypothetical protein